MNKILLTLFLLIAATGSVLKPETVFSATSYDINDMNSLEYFWSGDDEELYLNINLSEGLQFSGTYQTIAMTQGQGCEVTFSPIEGTQIFSDDGDLLQNLTLIVELLNQENPNEVYYSVIWQYNYQGINEKGVEVTGKKQFKREGVLVNPAVDLSQDPIFFLIRDELNHGVISFKNSFPYSNI